MTVAPYIDPRAQATAWYSDRPPFAPAAAPTDFQIAQVKIAFFKTPVAQLHHCTNALIN